MDQGTFRVPTAADGARHVEVDDATLEALLDGIEVDAASAPASRRKRVH